MRSLLLCVDRMHWHGQVLVLLHSTDEGEAGRAASEVDEALQLLGAAGVAQLAQGLGLDLADALAGDVEVLAHLLKGVVGLAADAEAHPQHLLLTRRQGTQDLTGLVGEVGVDHSVCRVDGVFIGDEVPEAGILLLADRRLQAYRLLGDLEDLADLLDRHVHLVGDLVGE